MELSRNDLHIHSCFSDGTDTPKQIIDQAKSVGIVNVSITDHDSIGSIKEAKEYATSLGLNFINGVELSTYSVMEIHMLGYGFDENNQQLVDSLNEFAQKRKDRVKKILDALAKYKIFIDEEDLAKSNSIGRLHVANALVQKGYVGSIPEAFDRYLGAHGCCYFPSMRITPLEGVKLIKDAGGIPVIAHPLRYYQQKRLEDLIIGLKPYGLGGIEVYYNTHDEATSKSLFELAKKYRLIATGGTDYHGKNRNIEIGSVRWNPDPITKKVLKMR